MTVHVQLDCPHPDCLTEKAGFSGSAFCEWRPGSQTYILLLQCGICGNGVIAKYRSPNFGQWVANGAGQVSLLEIWPKRPSIGAPEHLPANVERYYRQGMDSLVRKNFDAAGTMFRKALETSLKRLEPKGKGTLQNRIDELPAATGITPSMKEWAHQIRHLGNDAAHEEDPFTEEEARALQSFTELFLTYAFTLPGMLLARRADLEASL